MPELVLRLAVERLRGLSLAEEIASLDRSLSEHLDVLLADLNQLLLQSKASAQDQSTAVKFRKIEDIAYSFEDVIQRSTRSSSQTGIVKRIKSICKRWLTVAYFQKLRCQFEDISASILTRTDQSGSQEFNQVSLHQEKTNSNGQNLFGIEENKKKLLQVLLAGVRSDIPESSSSLQVISICGIACSSKTTLAKAIYEDPIVSQEFGAREWILVTDKFENANRRLANEIDRLKSQRSLIVLDDIRSGKAWDSLHKTLQQLEKGSKILVTTRFGCVAEYISPEHYIHRMRLVDKADSRALCRMVFSSPDPDYNELSNKVELCFLYLGHFIEDPQIDPEKLSHLWMIEGLLSTRERARGEKAMDLTERYLRELVLKGMVEVQKEEVPTTKKFKACSIVEEVKNVCVSSGEETLFLKTINLSQYDCSLSSSNERSEPSRLVIYLGEHKLVVALEVARNIRSLRIVRGNKQQEEEMVWTKGFLNLKEFKVLRILDFDGIDFRRQKLPEGIFNLELMKYLSFKGCILEELPSSISKLSYLLVLDLRVKESATMKIANVLWKMKRLKHLYLPMKFGTENGEKLQLDSLPELETLENFNTSVCKADNVSKFSNLRYLAAKVEGNFDDFVSIAEYMKTTSNNMLYSSIDIINMDCYAEERYSVLQAMLQCQVARVLHFSGHIGHLPPPGRISESFTQLVLNRSHLNGSSIATLEKLPNLGILILSDDAYMGKKIVCSASGFPQLKRLELVNLPSLQRLEAENTTMPQLSTLKVNNRSKLEIFPQCLRMRLQHVCWRSFGLKEKGIETPISS